MCIASIFPRNKNNVRYCEITILGIIYWVIKQCMRTTKISLCAATPPLKKWIFLERRGGCTEAMVRFSRYFCKDHRDEIEVPDPLAVEDLISYKLNE